MYTRKQSTRKPNSPQGSVSNESNDFSKEIKALRELLTVANSKLETLEDLNSKMQKMEKEITTLRLENSNLKKSNQNLRIRCENTEQRSFYRSIVLNGPQVIKRLKEVENKSAPYRSVYEAADQIIEKDIGITTPFDIIEAKRIGVPPKPGIMDRRPLYVEIDTVLTKKEIMYRTITTKPPGVFANEFLVGNRRHLLKMILELRKTRKDMKIQAYSRDGIINVKSELSNSTIQIKSQEDLEELIGKMERK